MSSERTLDLSPTSLARAPAPAAGTAAIRAALPERSAENTE